MKANFYLISKTVNQSFSKYKGSAVSISETVPKFVDEVLVGVKDHPEKTRKITTFKDESGKILERAYDYSGVMLKNRVFSYKNFKISNQENVESVTMKDYFIKKKHLPYYTYVIDSTEENHPPKNILWTLTDIVTNHVCKNNTNGRKVISQVSVANIEKPRKERNTFIEFPHIIDGKKQKTKNKILSFIVNRKTGKIDIRSIIAQKTKFPARDSFITYRALDIDNSKELFTRKYIKDKHLDGKPIKIDAFHYPIDSDERLYSGFFDPIDGSINFNRFIPPETKASAASTAAHETEHLWQHFLKAIFSTPSTPWEERIKANYKIKNPTRGFMIEIKKYIKSIQNYTALTKDLIESGNKQKYNDNYIEQKAYAKGIEEFQKYLSQGRTMQNNFRYIPKELL